MDPSRCPDPLAERRYAYAQSAAQDADWRTAAEVLEQALERAPAWAPALFAMAEAREKLGDSAGAAAAYAEALKADPTDVLGAGPRLALLERRDIVALPQAYVTRLFDDYAPRFDEHLRGRLSYRGPELIVEAIDRVAPGRRFGLALDLGCGSGLAGRAIQDRVTRLEGVDLSARMIDKAKETGVYDALEVGELVSWLEERAGADLAVAADTLIYLGDLSPVFAAVRRSLNPGGLFVFTVEAGEADFALGGSLRFRHSDKHLRAAAFASGFKELLLAPASSRLESGSDAPGRIAVFAA